MKDLSARISIVQNMDALIRNKNTGTAEEFAAKIHVSKRTLFVYLEVLKCLINDPEVTISYNSALKTYEYNKEGNLVIMAKWMYDKQADPLQSADHQYFYYSSSTINKT